MSYHHGKLFVSNALIGDATFDFADVLSAAIAKCVSNYEAATSTTNSACTGNLTVDSLAQTLRMIDDLAIDEREIIHHPKAYTYASFVRFMEHNKSTTPGLGIGGPLIPMREDLYLPENLVVLWNKARKPKTPYHILWNLETNTTFHLPMVDGENFPPFELSLALKKARQQER